MNIMKSINVWLVVAVCAMGALGCESNESAVDGAPEVQAPAGPTDAELLEAAIAERGEPCACVAENLEAMSAFLVAIDGDAAATAQQLNARLSEMLFPCLRPTNDPKKDSLYSQAIGRCDEFQDLTSVMNSVKTKMQERVELEAAKDAEVKKIDGKGAKDILDKLKSS
jgi:hypothetical protein